MSGNRLTPAARLLECAVKLRFMVSYHEAEAQLSLHHAPELILNHDHHVAAAAHFNLAALMCEEGAAARDVSQKRWRPDSMEQTLDDLETRARTACIATDAALTTRPATAKVPT